MLDCDLLSKAVGTARSLSSAALCADPLAPLPALAYFAVIKRNACRSGALAQTLTPQSEIHMIRHILFVGAMALAIPAAAYAQGVPDVAPHGARAGERYAGPHGAVVGVVVRCTIR